MEKIWILLLAILILLLFILLFWKVTHRYTKKKYGAKNWKQWSSKLSYWQAAILYSTGFTIITMYLLKWGHILNF